MIDPQAIGQLRARLQIAENAIADLEGFVALSGQSSIGHARQHGTDSHIPRNNFSATAPPTAGDDNVDGYGVGSLWIDVTNSNTYICLAATAGAAVWMQTTEVLDMDVKEGGVLVGGTGGIVTIEIKEAGVVVGTTSTGGAGIPSGGIIAWSGSVATIPSGWVLCDGTNGTPDLRGQFIIGAGGAYAVGATGGTTTHNHAGHTNHVMTQPSGHSAHVFTQPSAHSAHVFTQPSAHSAHVFTQPSAHDDHIITQPDAHTVTQPADHAAKNTGAAANWGTSLIDTGATPNISPYHNHPITLYSHSGTAVSAHSGTNLDSHSAHAGGAVDAHSAHAGGAVDAHSAHAGGAVDAHSAHAGGAVDAHSAHDSPSHLPPYYALAWIMKL